MTVYWTMKNGKSIDIDEMSIEHLRNTLKMIILQTKRLPKSCSHNIELAGDMANLFNDDMDDLEAEYDAEDFGCK
jgi:hypothetical protein